MVKPGNSLAASIVDCINSVVALPSSEAEKLLKIVQSVKMKKDEIFISAGSVPKKLGFVKEGLFRYYYTNAKGADFTKGFFPENSFITSYSAMIQQLPSFYTIQALEDSEVHAFDFSAWQTLISGHRCWSDLLMAILHKGYFKKEKREREFLLFDARERYQSFLEEFPELENRVKQSMIASYLGITPVALSRIRSQRVN